jgi:hypothetical protein
VPPELDLPAHLGDASNERCRAPARTQTTPLPWRRAPHPACQQMPRPANPKAHRSRHLELLRASIACQARAGRRLPRAERRRQDHRAQGDRRARPPDRGAGLHRREPGRFTSSPAAPIRVARDAITALARGPAGLPRSATCGERLYLVYILSMFVLRSCS